MSDAVTSPLGLLILPPWGWLLAGIWGALWGSFCNVAIHRLGLYESVVRPRSRCPRCSTAIAARDNIPIVGWLILRGRCRHCGLPISPRYPLVEALTCGLALAVYARFVVVAGEGDAVALLGRFFVYFAFVATMLVIAAIDLEHKIIPDAITYPFIPLFFICALVVRDVPPLELILGMVIGYGSVAVVVELSYWLLGREGMGYGDAKLLMLVGALLGWHAVAFAFFGGAILGAILVLPILLVRRARVVGVEVPFGPFLAAGAVLYLFFGRELLALLM
jgi:leader peptidase (prepilin peptidase)/N-methyltransferase